MEKRVRLVALAGLIGVAVGIWLNSPLGWLVMLGIIGGGAWVATTMET